LLEFSRSVTKVLYSTVADLRVMVVIEGRLSKFSNSLIRGVSINSRALLVIGFIALSGEEKVLFVFICSLPAFAAPIRGGGAVSTLSSRQGGEQKQLIFFELAYEKVGKGKNDLLASALSIFLLSASHRHDPSYPLLSTIQVRQLAVRRPGQDGAAGQQACSGMNIPPYQTKNKPKIIIKVYQNLASPYRN
jgi:hypothetical protein